jgi:hypothetical protein
MNMSLLKNKTYRKASSNELRAAAFDFESYLSTGQSVLRLVLFGALSAGLRRVLVRAHDTFIR